MIQTPLRLSTMRTIAGSLFFGDKMEELKKHKSVMELINLLETRGLIITEKSIVLADLQNINYYRLSGYLHDFKKDKEDRYIDGFTWEKLKRIYNFDRRFARILLSALQDIEETLKTRLSYTITSNHPDDPLIYLRPNIYREYKSYLEFISIFYSTVDNNRSLPFVKHHIQKYGGMLPMWVAIELFTMGNLHSVYDNLKARYQKEIAKTYCTGSKQLANWIKNLTYTRNHLAHYMRIYNFNFGRTPVKCKNHNLYKGTTNMIFDQIYIIGCMYSNACEWNHYIIPEMSSILEEYLYDISLSCIGFPHDWENILKK